MARFRTKARAVDLLGKQQIRDEITAISELLRNSFDADASEGLIDVSIKNESIVVWDDGDGMDEGDLINNWLTIGTYSKVRANPIRTSKGRVKIGEKGIGRLAISLLGNQLLIVSKKRYENVWSLLYLHWDLFRNENLFLEEIEIPIKNFDSINKIIHFLQNDFNILKEELIKNIENNSKWSGEIAGKIIGEIHDFSPSDDLFNRMKINELRGGGTTFYIKNIDNDWDWNVYKVNIEDESRKERKRRLQNVLVSFTNLIDLFDKREDEQMENSFTPRIHIDGLKLERESWFNPEDIELYDYALKGVIENGEFTGQIFIRNSSSIDVHEVSKIVLTSGIHTNSMIDCGPVYIKWFFIEGEYHQTSLTREQLQMMREKLINSGGIYVFRDGLRILPYGEQGNDFLKIEERRSKGAGYYLFSHRRMYGFMEISKMNNPNLIDKSSREGFVENNYYKHFLTTAQNLLIWWARDFFESQKENGVRLQRIKRLQEDREKEERMIKQQREEELRERQYFRELSSLLGDFSSRLNFLYQQVKNDIDLKLSSNTRKLNIDSSNSYEFKENLYRLKKTLYDLADKLEIVQISYNSRYSHPLEIMDQIDKTIVQMAESKRSLINYIDDCISAIKEPSYEEEEDGPEDNEVANLINKISQAISWRKSTTESIFKEIIDDQIISFKSEIDTISSNVLAVYENKLIEKRKNFLNPSMRELEQIEILLNQVIDKLQSFDFLLNPEEVKVEAESILKEYESRMLILQKDILLLAQEVKEFDATKNIKALFKDLESRISDGLVLNSDNDFIGLLKKEVTMYRDLSAVGLAAELTSHEFNALYSTIQENLNVLYRSLSKTKALPVVEKTRNAFKSLERLHQRMNPLYRQVRARKEKIFLKQFINSILEYFESDLERYQIKTFIKVPENAFLKETDSVLFTPIVNVVSNAIYWVLNQEQKEIHFYMNSEDKFYIHDTGPGIDPKDKDRVFEPYFTKKAEGRGLGLFLSRDILEARGHKLYLINPGEEILPYKGACFCIEFNLESLGVDE
ncbi:ATP-binding protein [Paenibacillus sp. BR2-3]|uniref:ATP-binding protein n=1 Tax=Paenibacillus sp. BR2-3 TaxID=3048494 RepID=UPI0039778DEC